MLRYKNFRHFAKAKRDGFIEEPSPIQNGMVFRNLVELNLGDIGPRKEILPAPPAGFRHNLVSVVAMPVGGEISSHTLSFSWGVNGAWQNVTSGWAIGRPADCLQNWSSRWQDQENTWYKAKNAALMVSSTNNEPLEGTIDKIQFVVTYSVTEA